MAIAEHASTPAVKTGTGTGTLTSDSFSPPAGSLLVALVAAELSGTTAPVIAIADSTGLLWRKSESDGWVGAARGGSVEVWYAYLASAPGAMTVSAGYTNLTGGRFLAVRVLTGASQYQGGATAFGPGTSSTSTGISITTTHTGSWVYGMSLDFTSAATFAANGTTTLVGSHVNTTNGATAAAWRASAAVAAPGTITPGGTWGSANTSVSAAVEILPTGAYITTGLTNGGATAHYQFAYDSALSPSIEPARTNAVLAQIENDHALIQSWFGSFSAITNLTVLVQTGSTGFAWGVGAGPTGTVITVNNEGSSFSAMSAAMRQGLLHEVAEIHMWQLDAANGDSSSGGWFFNFDNEGSAGEGLARFLAGILMERLGTADGYGILETEHYGVSNNWLNSARADYVNANAGFTGDVSDFTVWGCTCLFVYYLHRQLGYTIPQIVAAGIGASSLAQVAKNLTATATDPFPAFKSLIDTAFPSTTASQVGGPNPDNPFPLPHGAGTTTIVESSTAPTVKTGTGTGTLTTDAFSPPAGSLVVALASGEWGSTLPVGATISDSGAHTWTTGSTATGTTADGGVAKIAYCYFATAPGSITVSAAFTNLSGGRMLAVKVLTGTAGAAAVAAVAQSVATVADARAGALSIVTTQQGSIVYGISNDPNTAATFAANGATTVISSHVNTTNATSAAVWRATTATATPGSTKLGGSWSAVNVANVAAIEVLATHPTSSLVDAFDDHTVNATLWPFAYGTYSQPSGVATVTAPAAGGYSAYEATAQYTLADSQVSAKVTPPSAETSTYAIAAITCYDLPSSFATWARVYVDSVAQQVGLVATVAGTVQYNFVITYDPTLHAYIRLREAAGTLFLDTSPDGAAWTARLSDATPTAIRSSTTLTIDLEATRDASASAGTPATFDNLNGLTAAVSKSTTAAVTATGVAPGPVTGAVTAVTTAVVSATAGLIPPGVSAATAASTSVSAAAFTPPTPPAFGAAGTYLAGGNGTTAAIPVPAGVAAGHVVLVHLYVETTGTVTAPSGFTEVTPFVSVTGASAHTQRLFWKRATAADSGTYSFSWTGSVWREGVAERYTGCVTSGTPIDALGVGNSAVRASNGTVTPAVSLTTSPPGGRLLVWSGTNYTGGTWSAPTGFTNQATGASQPCIAVSSKTLPAAGASGSVTGTCSASSFETALIVALQPAVTPAAAAATVTAAAVVAASTNPPVLATSTVAALGGLAASATSRRTVFGAAVAGVFNADDYPSDTDEPSDTDYPGDGGGLGGLTAQASALYRAGTATAALGSLTATAASLRDRPGVATAPLGELTGIATGEVYHQGGTALLGRLTATAAGTRTRFGTASAGLGDVSSTATSYRARPGTAAAALGGLSGTATTAAPSPASSFFFAGV